MISSRIPSGLVSLAVALLMQSTWCAAQTPKIPGAVQRLMQQGEYVEAIKAIEAVSEDATAAKEVEVDLDYLSYLQGRCYQLQKDFDTAIAIYTNLEKQFPQSPWGRRARFAKAVAHARKGDFRAAETIYRAEAQYLLSADRKQELAEIYLEFADAYFAPPKEELEPDFAKALEFYTQALQLRPNRDTQRAIELRIASCHQELDDFDKAIAHYDGFIRRHLDHADVIEARFQLGETYLERKDLLAARRAWQDLLELHDSSKSPRIAEAMFRISLTHGLPTPGDANQLSLGIASLQAFLEKFPEDPSASLAHLRIGQSYQHLKRSEDASAAFRLLLSDARYADREEIPDARFQLGTSLKLQRKFDEAIGVWQQFLTLHPTHKLWSQAQREIINAELLSAQELFEQKNYDAAREACVAFLAKHPLDKANPGILYQLGHMRYLQERWDEAIADWRRLVSKYPGTNEASRAQFMIASTQEEQLDQFEEALDSYRKVTWGSHIAPATNRVARLTQKHLTTETPRLFRSNEVPAVRLHTRNIESVTVRVYLVDLDTYYRKMRSIQGVEKLDIALIDPDHVFEYSVPDYQDYKQFEQQLEVPVPAATDGKKRSSGVMAVTVSSKTLESTTLVLQSDLDIVTKCSRDEVFVFAQNMLTGEPWSGATVMVASSEGLFLEGETNEDGVFHQASEELAEIKDVRLFAVAEGHVAASNVSLNGLERASGLTNVGYIYTDRPAYRPQQLVHIRGIIRQAKDDRYVIPNAKTYSLSVLDNRNRLLHEAEVSLSEFGTFHLHYPLPAGCAPGQYRLLLADGDQESYQGVFQVQNYRLDPIHLHIDTPRNVYYRGEPIKGTIRVAYYYGAPLADREIRYQLQDGRVATATTNAEGEVEFELDTRDFQEAQPLAFRVTLVQENLQTSKTFFLATQAIRITAETPRDVYLNGETFEVDVAVTDPENEPVLTDLVLRVLRLTEVNGSSGEELIEELKLTTDEQGGVRKTLKIDEGGRYVLRLEGTDRFGNSVTHDRRLTISDDQDKVRLRILADQHTYPVGDVARVQLHWRERPALALVTFQGARILDYQLVPLVKGKNMLEIPITGDLAPNFELAVAVLTDSREDVIGDGSPTRLHLAASPFRVKRQLNVALDWKDRAKELPRSPGTEFEVEVRTTDSQGRPVSGEVSLAMVEQALLDRFPRALTAVHDAFRGNERRSAVRTTASITFHYRPRTGAISARLLAEADRREIEREELRQIEAVVEDARAYGWQADFDNSIQLGVQMQRGRRLSTGLQTQAGERGSFGLALQQPAGAFYESMQSVDAKEDKQVFSFFFGLGRDAPSARNAYSINALASPRFSTLSPTADDWKRDFLVLNPDGSSFNLSYKSTDQANQLQQLAEQGAILFPQTGPGETGYWNPSIVTDESGVARVTITLPPQSSAWQLTACGITDDTLAGESTAKIVTRKGLFGQLKTPAAVTDGDETDLGVTVHNDAVESGEITVSLTTMIGAISVTEKQVLPVEETGVRQLVFRQRFALPEGLSETTQAEFLLVVESGELRDVHRHAIPIHPYGTPVYAVKGGTADGDTLAVVGPPEEMKWNAARLQIVIGPSVSESLWEAILDPPTWCPQYDVFVSTPGDSATSDLLAALALQQLLPRTQEANNPRGAVLDQRVRSVLSQFIASQNDDGGWSWSGDSQQSNAYLTARTMWGLALARRSGYNVPREAFDKGVSFLRSALAQSRVTDYETKCVLAHALSLADQVDFTLANQLYRNRQTLSPSGLAYLALTFAEMDRMQTAGELLAILATRDLDRSPKRTEWLGAAQATAELHAIYAVALQKVLPRDQRLTEQLDWLVGNRTGHRWTPDKATGPAMLALCRWHGRRKQDADKYALDVFVNNRHVEKLEIEPGSGTRVVSVPQELLADGEQRVRIQLEGRGQFTYQCLLSGFVAADELKSTTGDWSVRRFAEPAVLETDGRPVPRGFAAVRGSYTSFRNPLGQLPAGQRGDITLEVVRHGIPANTPIDRLEYLVVTEPLAAGTTIVKGSVRGAFERFEQLPGRIVFYVAPRSATARIHYQVHGTMASNSRNGPTLVRNAYRLDQLAVTKPSKLTVLPADSKSADPYRLTPDELLELGKRAYAAKDYTATINHLGKLFTDWNLNPDAHKATTRMLLDAHLEQGPAAKVVAYFEIIIEKYPDLEIPFTNLLKVGDAYHEIGEYERSYLVFRAAVEASFMRESRVAGFLQQQGEFLRSLETMTGLLREYPPEPYVAAANYALAQQVYVKAADAAKDAKLREAKVTRVDLIRRAWTMLDDFLAAFADDPAADEASFSLANAVLELELYEQTIERCEQFARQFEQSEYLDSFWYIIGYCRYARGEHQQALNMCRKVADATRKDPATGRETESPNKWRAVYIMGQIHHSLGQAANAIAQYEMVKDRFADARQAINYFTRKALELPEVTIVRPDNPAELELTYRNLSSCDVTVYRIDLMKFSLLRQNLGAITDINLAGIRPFHQQQIQLGDGLDYRDMTREMNLPLKQEGAYLVVVRGQDRYASGLVLVSPLKLEVQEDAQSGRVRATVRDTKQDRYVHDVHVKIIGSRNAEFVSGETDLRGLFVADAIQGESLVIAQADQSRYAFYRGSTQLMPQTMVVDEAATDAANPAAAPQAPAEGELLKGLKAGNKSIQLKNQKQLEDLYSNPVDEGIGGGFGGGIF